MIPYCFQTSTDFIIIAQVEYLSPSKIALLREKKVDITLPSRTRG